MEALNAVVAIHEAVTDTEFEPQAVPYCAAGISVGEVAEFAAYNNNSLYYRGHPVDKALELCNAAGLSGIFVDKAAAETVNAARITSQIGRALARSPIEYLGNYEQQIRLAAFSAPIRYHEILWHKQRFGVRSTMLTRT